MDFGLVSLGTTSPPQTVTVKNVGSATLSGFTGGAPSASVFQLQNNCTSVEPRGSCILSFRISPSANGPANATSILETNAGRITITLQGQGATAALQPDQTTLDFGVVTTGQTVGPRSVTLTNTGTAHISGFSDGSPSSPRYALVAGCIGTLNPSESCTFAHTFTPNATAPFPATATIQTSAGPIALTLSGSGAAGISASPLELDFGEVGIGVASPIQTVTIRNSGSTTLEGFAGGAPPDTRFGATQNCAAGVAPGASCQYTFRFTPTQAGVFSSTSSSSTNAGNLVIRLRGNTPPSP